MEKYNLFLKRDLLCNNLAKLTYSNFRGSFGFSKNITLGKKKDSFISSYRVLKLFVPIVLVNVS